MYKRQGESRGREQSYSLNYQKLGRELMSVDDLATMDGGKCILQVRGLRPFLSDKYDIVTVSYTHLDVYKRQESHCVHELKC